VYARSFTPLMTCGSLSRARFPVSHFWGPLHGSALQERAAGAQVLGDQ
jgi:hypothetical protein